MKNIFLYSWLFLLFSISSYSQVNNNWVFGNKNILSFNTPTPSVSSLTSTTNFVGFEGCASVSDSNGNLLLFSDGVRLWKRNGSVDVLITNQLKGNDSSAQNVIFIKKPSFQNSYYIVTISGATGGEKGLFYSEVDVVNATMTSLNIPFKDNLGALINETYMNKSEAVTSTIHADNNKYWVIALVQQGNQGKVYSYLIDSTGVDVNPTPTPTGIPTMNPFNNPITNQSIGLFLKVSPDNLKIGLSYGRSGVFVGAFASNSGAVTFNNPVIYDGVFPNYDSRTFNSYGIEFSPDSSIFYFTSSNTDISIAYLNRLLVSPSSNLATLTTTPFGLINRDASGIQRAIDGLLYIANNTNNLSVINDPNNFTNPQIVESSITLENNSRNCLPQWVWQHPCLETLEDDRDPIPGGSTIFEERNDWIKSTAFIELTARVYYKAANYIELLPSSDNSIGFEAEYGSEFVAYIEGCTNNFVYRNGNIVNQSFEEKEKYDFLEKEVKELSIVPNPSSNSIEILMKNSTFNKVIITSTDGKIVLDKNIDNSESFQVDVSSYANGLYIVNVIDKDGQVYNQKLIKN